MIRKEFRWSGRSSGGPEGVPGSYGRVPRMSESCSGGSEVVSESWDIN